MLNNNCFYTQEAFAYVPENTGTFFIFLLQKDFKIFISVTFLLSDTFFVFLALVPHHKCTNPKHTTLNLSIPSIAFKTMESPNNRWHSAPIKAIRINPEYVLGDFLHGKGIWVILIVTVTRFLLILLLKMKGVLLFGQHSFA